MKIAIQGHPTRGKELIQILENLGGINSLNLLGTNNCRYYYICNDNVIRNTFYDTYYKIYTLEGFKKEFPFKVGDIVITNNDRIGVIEKLILEDISGYYIKTNNGNYWCNSSSLRLYKEMEEKRNISITIHKAKEWYSKGGELKEIALQAFTEKELTKVDLPKTWEEFCGNYPIKEGESYAGDSSEIYTHCKSNGERDSELDRNMCPTPKSAEAHLALIQLEQLRDCYRGLFVTVIGIPVWCIRRRRGELIIEQRVWGTNETFLSFQSKEVAEKYLKNFKPLIEKAGDLI